MKNTILLCIVGIFIAANSHAQTFLTNGLVAYYPFSGNANDASGNGNNGSPQNAVLTTDRFGVVGHAYQFNGTNAYVSAPNQTYLNLTNGQFTISLWASLDAEPNSLVSFLSLDNGGGGPKWIFFYGQPTIPYPPSGYYAGFHVNGVPDGDNYWLATTRFAPALGAWHQYIVTQMGTNYTVYIDGTSAFAETNYMYHGSTQVSGVGGPATIPSGITAPLTIGEAEGGNYFGGELDDIRIYNRALSSTEVAQLFAIESPPIINLQKAVYLTCNNLWTGSNYQVQASSDLINWTNQGSVFTATSSYWRSTNYWDVDNWNQLFFRLQIAP